MTNFDYYYANIGNGTDNFSFSKLNAYVVLWLEAHGWFQPSGNDDGGRRPPFTLTQAESALGSGMAIHFHKGGETIDIDFVMEENEATRPEFRLNGEIIPDLKELLRRLAGVEEAFAYVREKLELNAWGFQRKDVETENGGIVPHRMANALKTHYTVFRRWSRKVDTVTRDIQLCRWDFGSGTYRAVDEDDVHLMCKEVIQGVMMKTAREVYRQLRNDPAIETVTEIYKGGLPVANGDMNVFTGEIEEPTPEHFVVSRLKAAWHGECQHPAVDTVFGIFEDEVDRKAIKTYIGYVLTPLCSLRKMALLYGNPRSGKSTFSNAVIKGLIGTENVKVFNLNHDFGDGDTGRFGLQGWEGATLAYCDEIGSGRIPDSGPLKSVVAGEPVAVDRKGLAKVSVILTSKILMCTNHIPNFQDTSSAVLDRLIPIDVSREPFPCGGFNQAVFEEPEFGSAMLWEVVHALQEFATQDDAGNWRIEGEIPISERSQELLATAREKSNPIVAVFERWLQEDGDEVIGASWSVFTNSKGDYRQSRYAELYDKAFSSQLEKKPPYRPTADATLKNTPIKNPATGIEERYQIVEQFTVSSMGQTACGFVARFSHDRKENNRFKREAAEKYLERKGGNGDGVVLKIDAGLDYNSEMVL